MSKIIFKRKLYAHMLRWKNESSGKTALLIKGARRVGSYQSVRQRAQFTPM
jgi:hypothetical protein